MKITRKATVKIIKECEHCGDNFKTTEYRLSIGKGKFCSKECHLNHQKKFGNVIKICSTCEENYTVSKSQDDKYNSKYCSLICRNIGDTKKIGSLHHNFTSILINCDFCSEEYYEKKYKVESSQSNFCGIECRQQWFSSVWSQSEEWKEESSIRATKMISDGLFATDTQCQKVTNNLLDKLEIKYENEYNCKYFAVDNYLTEHNLMIEVMGTFWHSDPRFYNKVKYERQRNRIINDKRKSTYIQNKYNIKVLYLWEYDLLNYPMLCEVLINKYIDQLGVLDNYHSFNYFLVNENMNESTEAIIPYFKFNIEYLNKNIFETNKVI